MNGHGVTAVLLEWLKVPGRPALNEFESCAGTLLVVSGQVVATTQLEAANYCAARAYMASASRHQRGLRSGASEEWHVARHDDYVEHAPELEVGKIRHEPRELGCPLPGSGDHRRLGVDADDLDASSGQFDRDSSSAAPGVEHRTRAQRRHEVRLAMDVETVCGEGVEASLEVVPVPNPGLPQLKWSAISGQDSCSLVTGFGLYDPRLRGVTATAGRCPPRGGSGRREAGATPPDRHADTPGPGRQANVDGPAGVAELAVGQLPADRTESTIQPFASVPWSVRRAMPPGNE
jgi:hypothetical protein